jgi:predicted GNAT family acetyltransferase
MTNPAPSEDTVQNHTDASRYELRAHGHTAVLVYEREGDRILLQHTSVPDELEGQGIGAKLARAALDDARANGLTVVPNCPFVASYIRRHPDYLPLVVESRRRDLERG